MKRSLLDIPRTVWRWVVPKPIRYRLAVARHRFGIDRAARRLTVILTAPWRTLWALTLRHKRRSRKEVLLFLQQGRTLDLAARSEPVVSVLLVLYNRAELTLQCLLSLQREQPTTPLEVILIDNASSDETGELLSRLSGATVVRNDENRHFLLACNQGARLARGRLLLLLNNDAELTPGALPAAIATHDGSTDIGTVGARIVHLNGRLQEAGSILWSDASCLGYGRGQDSTAPPFLFRRDVDYCSGAFLLTSTALFLEMGGFDETFRPAYYEETDYCTRLWKRGLRSVYEPRAVVRHVEFASSRRRSDAIALQRSHQRLFAERHAEYLSQQVRPSASAVLDARIHRLSGVKALVFDDQVPYPYLGSGFPRSLTVLREIHRLCGHVTFFPLTHAEDDWDEIARHLPADLEVMLHRGWAGLKEFLTERSGYYDLIWVSRPHNMERFRRASPGKRPERLIYDAEAIYALRDQRDGTALEKRLAEEVALARTADAVVCVSEAEARHFRELEGKKTYLIGHPMESKPTASRFEARSGLLFVGAVHQADSPNADSLIWLAREILPRLADDGVKLRVIGLVPEEVREKAASRQIEWLGRVDDLTAHYDRALAFVAPTRFGAGIPYKVHHAAAHGLPVVTTPLIASQLGWNEELLIGGSADEIARCCRRVTRNRELWTSLRERVLARIEEECTPDRVLEPVRRLIGEIGKRKE